MSDEMPFGAEPIPVKQANIIPTRSVTINRYEEIEKAMSQVLNLSEGNIFHETTCLVCSSSYRDEAEKLYASSGSIKLHLMDPGRCCSYPR